MHFVWSTHHRLSSSLPLFWCVVWHTQTCGKRCSFRHSRDRGGKASRAQHRPVPPCVLNFVLMPAINSRPLSPRYFVCTMSHTHTNSRRRDHPTPPRHCPLSVLCSLPPMVLRMLASSSSSSDFHAVERAPRGQPGPLVRPREAEDEHGEGVDLHVDWRGGRVHGQLEADDRLLPARPPAERGQ